MGEILEIRLEPGGMSALLDCPPSLCPSPGQYLLASTQSFQDLLPVVLFPASLPARQLALAAPLPAHWTAGTRLSLRGPLGRGFHLPPHSRRVALAALGISAGALLPLALQALQNGAAVTLYTAAIPEGLPAQVEVLPPDLLLEAPTWADYLAVDLPAGIPTGSSLRALFNLKPLEPLACPAEILVRLPMPCAGTAECGVCALHTRSGWKLACKDGPVFDFRDGLEG